MQIKLQINSTTAIIDGKPVVMAAAPQLIDNRTMLPLRAFEEALGSAVTWLEEEQTVLITTGQVVTLPDEPVPDWRQVPDPDVKPWSPWDAPITSNLSNRSAARLEAVILQCGVATAPRYRANQQGGGETYCNIFLSDVTRALGCEIPHWVNRSDRATPCAPDYTYRTAVETDANGVCDWLMDHGSAYGYRRVDGSAALAYANAGKPAVVVWKNSGGIGHVAIVRPGSANTPRGVPSAQAGTNNFDNGYVADGFGQHSDRAAYYVHD